MSEAKETIISAEMAGNADYPYPDSDISDWPSREEAEFDAENRE